MVKTGLGSGVRKSLEGGDAQSIDAANIDDACWGARGRSGFKKGCDSLRELKDTFQVEVEDTIPCCGGILVEGLAPVAAAVVDEDVELCNLLVSATLRSRCFLFKTRC